MPAESNGFRLETTYLLQKRKIWVGPKYVCLCGSDESIIALLFFSMHRHVAEASLESSVVHFRTSARFPTLMQTIYIRIWMDFLMVSSKQGYVNLCELVGKSVSLHWNQKLYKKDKFTISIEAHLV